MATLRRGHWRSYDLLIPILLESARRNHKSFPGRVNALLLLEFVDFSLLRKYEAEVGEYLEFIVSKGGPEARGHMLHVKNRFRESR